MKKKYVFHEGQWYEWLEPPTQEEMIQRLLDDNRPLPAGLLTPRRPEMAKADLLKDWLNQWMKEEHPQITIVVPSEEEVKAYLENLYPNSFLPHNFLSEEGDLTHDSR